MKKMFAVLATALAMASYAEETNEDVSKMTPQEKMARRDRIVMERHGGFLTVKGTPCGSIVIVNTQKAVAPNNFDIETTPTGRRLKGLVKVVEDDPVSLGEVPARMKKHAATLAIFIVEDAALPPSLIAVEDKWAIMNIAALKVGAKSDKQVAIRAKNEFARVFAMLCGAMCSQFKAPLMNFVTKVSDLDRCSSELPVDVGAKLLGYLEQCGVKPEKKVYYRKACEEGWAPQPTNDYQKAVWNQVYEKPSEPILIKYDPKKGE